MPSVRSAATQLPTPDRREAILRAALALMSERTFGQTSVPEIADRAGVAAGTIYRHFASKEELVNVLYRECKARMAERLERAAHGARNPRDLVRRLWRGLFVFFREAPQALRFLELHHHQPYLDDASRQVSSELFARIGRLLADAQAHGSLRSDPPPLLLAMAFGAFVGFVKEADAGHVELDESSVEASERLVWALLRAPDPMEVPHGDA